MPQPPIDVGFTKLLGMRFVEISADKVVLTWKVTPQLLQPFGIFSNQTDFLRAVRDGTLTATGVPIHRGRSQQLWQVEITDEQARLVARGQVRLQNLTEDGWSPGQ